MEAELPYGGSAFWRIEMEGIVAKIWNIKEGTMGRGAAVQITDSISYITNSENVTAL